MSFEVAGGEQQAINCAAHLAVRCTRREPPPPSCRLSLPLVILATLPVQLKKPQILCIVLFTRPPGKLERTFHGWHDRFLLF